MAFSHQLVLRSATFLFRRFRGEQVTEARRAAHQLPAGGEFEALGDGFFRLLHEWSVKKHRA